MNYNPSKETLHIFLDCIKDKHNNDQVTTSELARYLPSKAEAGRLLEYLTIVSVLEQRHGGGYFLSGSRNDCQTTLVDLIENGPIIYPRNPEEPVKIYGSIEYNYPEVRIEAYGCEIRSLPTINTIQDTETKRRIVQATTLITPSIVMDGVNQWILKKFFDDMCVGDFALQKRGVVIPATAENLYTLSASNISLSVAKPVATFAYFLGNDLLNGFREFAETLMSYERRLEQVLDIFYPEITEKSFWEDYNKNVRSFVIENSGRIRSELVEKVMKSWHPQILETQAKVEVVIEPKERKSGFRSLLKKLFGN